MTYSQSLTGVPADYTPNQPAVLTVSDSVGNGLGAQALAMQLNTPFLCKGPDGGQALYTYVAGIAQNFSQIQSGKCLRCLFLEWFQKIH